MAAGRSGWRGPALPVLPALPALPASLPYALPHPGLRHYRDRGRCFARHAPHAHHGGQDGRAGSAGRIRRKFAWQALAGPGRPPTRWRRQRLLLLPTVVFAARLPARVPRVKVRCKVSSSSPLSAALSAATGPRHACRVRPRVGVPAGDRRAYLDWRSRESRGEGAVGNPLCWVAVSSSSSARAGRRGGFMGAPPCSGSSAGLGGEGGGSTFACVGTKRALLQGCISAASRLQVAGGVCRDLASAWLGLGLAAVLLSRLAMPSCSRSCCTLVACLPCRPSQFRTDSPSLTLLPT